MKTIITLFICLLSAGIAVAQMPKAINYQAVARKNTGEAIAGQSIKVRLSVINSASGNAVIYSETRQVTTNALGLFNVQIGSAGALATTGSFNAINWTNNTTSVESLKVELDINNNGTFVDMGAQGLVTVPYAFAADEALNAINIGGHYIDTNTPKSGDLLKWDGSAWKAQPAAQIMYVASPLSNTSASNLGFQAIYESPEITVYPGQTVVVNLMGVLGATISSNGVGIGPVYRRMSDNLVVSFSPAAYNSVASVQARQLYTVAGALKVVPPGDPLLASGTYGYIAAGNYKFGYGVRNVSPNPLNDNENVNGYIVIQ
ncbi:hypothetical protein GCM10023091_19370 [Ravibacter arvi]|uniref:Uncharacterized protein n=1 Tax=Ravibacter arvi TaxID=2051041 RepID=A0ABP8LWC5_9BACT